MNSFSGFALRPETRAALAAMAVETPTPIQTTALPHLLAGRDIIGQARTGSGKTLAFVLPLVERVDERRREVQALVLVPTRELAAQVAGVVGDASAGRAVRVLLVVGGSSVNVQRQALVRGAQVVVGTPGRVLDHIRQGNLRLEGLRLLVLDEADEMLDRGFAPDVERIIAATNPGRQTALLSATVPDWVSGVAARHLRNPVTLRVDAQMQPVAHVPHTVYDVPDGGKLAALRSLLALPTAGVTLVFGRTKHGVRKLARQLEAAGYPVAALQGNLSQPARDRVMAGFRSGTPPILVATNVAARGLDVEDVARVINYELPETAALLTHRVGRTGRMGRSGEAVTLLTSADQPAWRKLVRDLHRQPARRPWPGSHAAALTADAQRNRPQGTGAAMADAPSPSNGGQRTVTTPFGGRSGFSRGNRPGWVRQVAGGDAPVPAQLRGRLARPAARAKDRPAASGSRGRTRPRPAAGTPLHHPAGVRPQLRSA